MVLQPWVYPGDHDLLRRGNKRKQPEVELAASYPSQINVESAMKSAETGSGGISGRVARVPG